MRAMILGVMIASGIVFNACSSSPSGPDFTPGKWSITSESEVQGMPMQMPETTFEQCLGAEELVPVRNNPAEGCSIAEQTVQGDTVSWRYECANSKGEGSVTYSGKSFAGSMTMKSDTPMGSMTVKTTMSGRYLGACD